MSVWSSNLSLMTFAVAAFCPYPFWPGIPARGIVFVADTRYSFPDKAPGQKTPPFDFGMKVAALGTHAGCVCAGDARSAQLAVGKFEAYFRAEPRAADPTRVMADLRAHYSAAVDEARRRGVLGDFAIVVGCLLTSGNPVLLGIGPESQLIGQPEWGLMIGQRRHQALYEASLKERVTQEISGPSFSFEVDQWVLPYVMPLQVDLIDAELDATVGGGLQVAVVDPSSGFGYRDVLIADTSKGDDMEWQRATRDVTFDWTHLPTDAAFSLEVLPLVPPQIGP
jgi:hypothetical protein